MFRGFDSEFRAPHSRHTEVREEDILANPSLRLLSRSDEAGVHIVEAMNGRQLFVLGHGEYDRDTLKAEYIRDRGKGMNPKIPEHYFPDDDPTQEPLIRWRSHAHLFYTNWLNYYVYQSTPYVIESL